MEGILGIGVWGLCLVWFLNGGSVGAGYMMLFLDTGGENCGG